MSRTNDLEQKHQLTVGKLVGFACGTPCHRLLEAGPCTDAEPCLTCRARAYFNELCEETDQGVAEDIRGWRWQADGVRVRVAAPTAREPIA